jgi:MYXO-CTERM domain-containing protein
VVALAGILALVIGAIVLLVMGLVTDVGRWCIVGSIAASGLAAAGLWRRRRAVLVSPG